MVRRMQNNNFVWIVIFGVLFFSATALADIKDETISEGIILQKLKNKGSLGQTEIDFLDELIHSVFAELPRDRFEIVSPPSTEQPECDDECQVSLAKEQDASWLVIGTISPFGDGYAMVLKLYKVDTGQLHGSASTGPKATLEDILIATKTAAFDVRDRLLPMSRPTVSASTESASTNEVYSEPTPQSDTQGESVISTILIETDPPGATIYISRDEDERGESVGRSPLKKKLLPLTYWVTAEATGYETAKKKILVDPANTGTFRFSLVRIYPRNPYKVAGHGLFWPGLALSAFGAFSAAKAKKTAEDYNTTLDPHAKDSSRSWTGTMWASFGIGAILMTTGIIMWAKSPGDKEWFERRQAVSNAWLSPTGDGGLAISYSRRF